jgi:hypothetical protein
MWARRQATYDRRRKDERIRKDNYYIIHECDGLPGGLTSYPRDRASEVLPRDTSTSDISYDLAHCIITELYMFPTKDA